MKKLFTIVSALVLFAKADAQNTQTKRVGINKDNPAYTLDVEGSMRIGELGVSSEHSKLLAWDPDTQQVVFSPDKSIQKPFYNLVYTIVLGHEPHEDWSRSSNIGIDDTKYKVILTQASLVSKDFSYTNPDAGKMMITAMTQSEAGEIPEHAGIRDGRIKSINPRNPYVISNTNAGGRYLGYPIASTIIMNEAETDAITSGLQNVGGYDRRKIGMYRFLADYEFARPVYTSAEKSSLANRWMISVLIMDKTLVTDLPTSEIQ